MGCGASRSGERSFGNLCKSEGHLVSLCKERRDLIKAARDCRYALAESHVLYLRSLLDVGEAVEEFVRDAVVVSVDSPSRSSLADSPLHSDGGSHLELSSVDSESVFLGSLTEEVHREEKEGRSKLASPRPPVDSRGDKSQFLDGENVSYMARFPTEAVAELHEPAREFSASFGEEYMPNMPPMYHHADGFVNNNYWFPADRIGGATNPHYNGYIFSGYGNGSSSSYPVNSSVYGNGIDEDTRGRPMDYFGGIGKEYPPYVQLNPNPIPSPPVADSNTDYFNLFGVTDDFYSKYYSRNMFGDGLGGEYSNLNDLREEEGIPPLEEVEEDTSSASASVRDTQADETNGTSDAQPLESDEKIMTQGNEYPNQNGQVEEEKENQNAPTCTDSVEKEAGEKEADNSSGDDKIIEEGEPSSQLKEAVAPVSQFKDILAAMPEITRSFSTAYNSGKEVTEILEAGKIPYLSAGSMLKGFCHRILGAVAPSSVSLQTTYMLRKLKMGKTSYLVKNHSYRPGTMSSTLDKLYTWEKKLYKEVKSGENHRAVYDKLYKRSKMLTSKGAESDKIEAVQAKIRNLIPQLDVSVSAVSAISRRIQHVRDEELRPQVSALIHGLSRMWKSMSQCHQAQVRAATVDSKEKMDLSVDLSRTEDLKLQILRWRSRFCEMVKAQRAFAAFLAGWLSKFPSKEAAETEDGAPAVILSCHNWTHALDTAPVSRASSALQALASSLHQLWAKQNEERSLRLRVEFLEGWIASTSSRSEARHAEELKNARRNLEELKVAHAGVCGQVRSAASRCLEEGLVEALKAAESVCTEMSRAYDQIRL
uniref:Uncharacterized protein n=1 Tax=Kalanchoe fedtschenkoi TaxID=63787 RepID=A0A7N0ZXF0_KALFE